MNKTKSNLQQENKKTEEESEDEDETWNMKLMSILCERIENI